MAKNKYLIESYIYKATDIENMGEHGVYKLFHIDDPDKIYIGSSISRKRDDRFYGGFYVRWSFHLSSLRRKKHECKSLQKYVNSHGVDGIRFEILEVTESFYVREREKIMIELLKPFFNKDGVRIQQFTKDGDFIDDFVSVQMASKKTGIDYTSISATCSGRRPSAGGYVWKKAHPKEAKEKGWSSSRLASTEPHKI